MLGRNRLATKPRLHRVGTSEKPRRRVGPERGKRVETASAALPTTYGYICSHIQSDLAMPDPGYLGITNLLEDGSSPTANSAWIPDTLQITDRTEVSV